MKSDLDAPTTIAICAQVIAVAALGLASYESCANRRHQRLSVRPAIEISFNHTAEGMGWAWGNDGLGPAVVKWIEVRLDGEPVGYWHQIWPQLGIEAPNFSGFYPGSYMRVGSHGRLLWDPESSSEFRDNY